MLGSLSRVWKCNCDSSRTFNSSLWKENRKFYRVSRTLVKVPETRSYWNCFHNDVEPGTDSEWGEFPLPKMDKRFEICHHLSDFWAYVWKKGEKRSKIFKILKFPLPKWCSEFTLPSNFLKNEKMGFFLISPLIPERLFFNDLLIIDFQPSINGWDESRWGWKVLMLTCNVWSSPSNFLLAAEMEVAWADNSLSCSWASLSSCSACLRPRSACSSNVLDSSNSFCRALALLSEMPNCSRASSRALCSSSRAVCTSLSCCW